MPDLFDALSIITAKRFAEERSTPAEPAGEPDAAGGPRSSDRRTVREPARPRGQSVATDLRRRLTDAM